MFRVIALCQTPSWKTSISYRLMACYRPIHALAVNIKSYCSMIIQNRHSVTFDPVNFGIFPLSKMILVCLIFKTGSLNNYASLYLPFQDT